LLFEVRKYSGTVSFLVSSSCKKCFFFCFFFTNLKN
jgi:hypothetical protein